MGRLSTPPAETSYGRAWYAVGVLMLLYCLSFTDRLILALLAPAVTETLGVSDTQIGLLFGVGFGVLYALVGLPLAQLIDRSHRVRIVVAGVTLWSLCTIGSGFANTFTELMILRSGVAIGEAVLSPAAISIIADMFPRERRTAPTSAYASVGTFMSTGAFMAGGAALDLANHIAPHLAMQPWRLALVVVGAPGLILAPLLLLTVREPLRAKVDAAAGEAFSTARQALAYVRGEGRLYGCLFIAQATYGVVAFSYMGWTPTILIRGHQMAAAQAGYMFGTIGALAGVAGAALTPWIAAAWTRRGRSDALILVLAAGCAVGVAAAFMTGFTRNPAVVFAAAGCLTGFGAVAAVMPPLIIQYVTPGRMRARILAGNFMATNLVGLTVGPALTAWISEHVFAGRFAIASSLAVVAAIFGPIAVIAILLARPAYARALQLAERREADAMALDQHVR